MPKKIITPFAKYQGTGNDFIMFNFFDPTLQIDLTTEQIVEICDRRFGVGADGIILLKPAEGEYDFSMEYYNSDGSEGFCGNGGRCIVAFAHQLGIIKDETSFIAMDGPHTAIINADHWVELKMCDVDEFKNVINGIYLNTGTDHYVEMVENLNVVDVVKQGRPLRYHKELQPKGANVNFVSGDTHQLQMLTYERGVEDETFACGTGTVAAAMIAVKQANKIGSSIIPVKAKGGDLKIRFHYDGHVFTDVWLCGPAEFVFAGEY